MAKTKKAKKTARKAAPRAYAKPKVKKHENLKDITLLSFNPPNQ